jgi:hypothetical protein
MTQPNDFAAPQPHQNSDGSIQFDVHHGLTKREYFASLAMQGLVTKQSFPERVANDAVQIADALIKALNQTPTPLNNTQNKEG